MKQFLCAAVLSLFFFSAETVFGQTDSAGVKIFADPVNLEGPRVGATYLSDTFVNGIKKKAGIQLTSMIAQFGWHFEHRFFSLSTGATAVTEAVLLIGGFEQERFLPSITWLLGWRTPSGIEFGAGPNIAVSGTSVVAAAGITIQTNEINFPINLAVASSKSGPRFTLLVGFNLRTNK